MAEFEPALEAVLHHEGGYGNDPADPGGPTNWGISLRYVLDELGWLDIDGDGDTDADDIRALTRVQAARIYRERWWDRYGYAAIPNQQVATKVFDAAVNMGARQAHRLAQRALCRCGLPVAVDGVLGPKTMRALVLVRPTPFLRAMYQAMMDFYATIVVAKPTLSRFLGGWQARARWPLAPAEVFLA